jgi:predicted O-methyltransferase YrrM
MTPQEFGALVESIGIPFIPDIDVTKEIQFQCATDPSKNDRASITQNEGRYLASWAAGLRVLEIGTGLGVSTVCLASTAKEVMTIDPSEWVRAALKLPANVVQLASFDEVHGGEFDMAFIDGLHDKRSVMRDIVDCLQVVKYGGSIAFHDLSHGTVQDAVKAFAWGSREEMDTTGKLTRCWVPA